MVLKHFMSGEIAVFGFLILIFSIIGLAFFLFKTLFLVKQAEVVIVERLGKFHKILGPGMHILIPFIDEPREVLWSFLVPDDRGRFPVRITRVFTRIDLRESVYDFPKQSVITKDNVMMEISALLYYQITDPELAVYGVMNLPEAIEKLTQTTLRNLVGSLDLDESLVSRDKINEKLQHILDDATHKWGVKINRVELQEVNPPEDIRQAMEKQMRAERDRRARILEAEGMKQALITEAEGIQESTILKATGDAQSAVIAAQGEAEARLKLMNADVQSVQLIAAQLPQSDPLAYLIAMNYIKSLQELTKGKNDKLVVVPYEASSLMGSFASIKTLFEQRS
ncbi:MAG TPA: SPFH domain-containing protein [Candidatus Babeliales bacterium]|nr:SPFH domain-containing protein [Candidatus Babeliales bacterium]